MNEWTVVSILIAIVGLIATVAKPLMQLTKAITQLTSVTEAIQKKQDELAQAHEKLDQRTTEGRHKIWGELNDLKESIHILSERIAKLEEHIKGGS